MRRLAYKAFGEEVVNSGTGEKPPYTYTGKELDSTGLMYYGARYYDPALARFITPDMVADRGTQGLNRYAYALNNPIRYTDPSGHESYDSRFHVERANTLLDLQVHVSGTDGMGISELGHDERAAVVAALGVNHNDSVIVDGLEAMRLALGLPTPERGMHMLTAEDIGGLLRWQAERNAGRPALSQWEERARQTETGEQFFAGCVLFAWIIRANQPAITPETPELRTSHGTADRFQFGRLKAQLAQEELLGAEPVGSALKGSSPFSPRTFGRTLDISHNSPTFMRDSVRFGSHFTIRGYDGIYRNLSQLEGSVNEERGIFEYITGPEGLTHQRFIGGGRITGYPNQ